MISFSDIQDALFFVSSAGYGMHSAVFCKDTGRIWEKCIEIPHKKDLDLGQSLVFEFVEMHLPDDYDRVRQMFRRPGAYGRFKDLLDSKGLLEVWYSFENQREEHALRQWCMENEIELSE